MKTEKRTFSMHPKLLYDVIQRQAGSLEKGIMEGVMNAIDARATKIKIKITPCSVTIEDNGKGFQGREEIEKFFEVFGQPHDESENKIFGTFRMGRGQLFAFGYNSWQTDRFAMDVDIKNHGLDYQLSELKCKTHGCCVTVALYTHLTLLEQRRVEDELKRNVRYSNVPITLNGETITVNAAEQKWTRVDDNAYYQLSTAETLRIYNLGILVHIVGSFQYGLGGVVVSRKQLKLNFARNDVQSDCPVWRRICALIREEAGEEVVRKKTLTEGQRLYYSRLFAAEQLPIADVHSMSLFTDVRGKHWCAAALGEKYYYFSERLTAAPLGDARGDMLMQTRVALVLSSECLERLGLANVDELIARMNAKKQPGLYGWRHFKAVDFESVAATIDDKYDFIDRKEWTTLETELLAALGTAQYQLQRERRQQRRILLGASHALAWTDGSTYIAFDRRFLRKTGHDLAGWTTLLLTLVHEMCHDDPDTDSHVHSPEFYERYHDLSIERMGKVLSRIVGRWNATLTRLGKRLTRKQLQDKMRTDNLAAGKELVARF